MLSTLNSLRHLPVLCSEHKEQVGTVDSVLIHPKTFTIEGIFVSVPTLFTAVLRFVPQCEIERIGTQVLVRSEDSLCDASDIVRLQQLLNDPLPVLYAKVFTAEHEYIGKVKDAQYSTDHFTITQLLIAKYLRPVRIVSTRSVLRVTPKGIFLRSTNTEPADPLDVIEEDTQATLHTVLEA